MGNLKGVDIKRGAMGASVLTNEDVICGLLVNAPAIPADEANGVIGLEVGKTVKIASLKDAEAYGITADYDAANAVRLYRHISEFYRMAQAGTPLYVCLYAGDYSDSAEAGKQMLADAEGNIRQLAIAYNPAANYAATYTDGLETAVREMLPKAQALADWAFDTFKPCQIILEGRGLNALNSTVALDLRDIQINGEVVRYEKVTLCIGQDWDYAETQNTVGKKMADVGTLLGCVAALPVNHNVGEVETINLSDSKKERWLTAGLSNHKTIAEMHADLEDYDEKGYVFAINYEGYAGKYWNNDHTCTPVIVDEDDNMNEYSISLGRTHDKAVRLLRKVLLPKVKSTQPVDAKTGKLPVGIVKSFENLGDTKCFDKMLKAGEISYGKTTVDANSNLLTPPRELKVSFVIVPTGQVDVIKGTINLKTSV
jgi:hypothetical protein